MDWLETNCRSILLVGEANFSFALSLANHFQKKVSITASSFETESDVKGRLRGADNVALLRQLGAELLFQVDATKLHETDPIQHNQYDAIIFNFPHVGRKGGINKNRQLLKDFFKSSCNLLTPSGRVMVSLCNGQGGTPADTPQREWNNSWQIVAMATYGGFILRAAIPFTTAYPVEYCNTGYRSQNKKFVNEHAVTHVFVQGPLWSLPTGKEDPLLISTDGGVLYSCPDDLSAFKTRKLLREANHPLHKMSSDIITALSARIPNLCEKHINISEIALEKHSQCKNEIIVEVKSEVKDHSCHGDAQDTVRVLEVKGQHLNETSNVNCDASNIEHDVHVVDGALDEWSNDGGQAVNTLVSNLLQHTRYMLQGDTPPCPIVATSEVYHRCPVGNLHILPIMHQMLVILPYLEDFEEALWDSFEDVMLHILKTARIEDVEKWSDLDVVHGSNNHEIPEMASNSYTDDEYSVNQHILCTLPESVQISDMSFIINAKASGKSIGVCGKLICNSKTAKFMLLNLDWLVMCKFNFDDIRLLWSDDTCQWDHLQNVDQDLSQATSIERISQFAPRYIHDLSFWASAADGQFDTLALISVVWKIAGLFIEEFKLLDLFEDGRNERVGLCYRLVYQSIDKALSKDQARMIQSVVRETVRRKLSIDLR